MSDSTEYQILEAFDQWHKAARTIHAVESLPSGQELLAAAQDPSQLEPGTNHPALLVWASALRRARALALIGNLDPILTRSDPRLFEPDMTVVAGEVQPSPEVPQQQVYEGVVEPMPQHQQWPSPQEVHEAEVETEQDANLDQVFPPIFGTEPDIPEPEYSSYQPEPTPEPASPQHQEAQYPEPEYFSPQPEPAVKPAETWIPEPEYSSYQPEPQPAETPLEGHLSSWQPHQFRGLDFFSEVVEVPGAQLNINPTSDGSLELSWSVPDDGAAVQVYRVLSDESEFARDLQHGEDRAITLKTRWVDSDPLSKAFRVYQVWLYEGSSESAAVQSEPRLVGERYFILPIDNIDLSVAGSVITGQWAPVENTHRVAVFRAPATERRIRSPQNEIVKQERNREGFRFTPEHRGVDYKFVAERFVLIGGNEVASAPSEEFTITMPAEVVEVPIEVTPAGSGVDARFDVRWQQPHSGNVRIYRTENPPADGLQDRVVEVEQLEGFGLPDRDRANFLNQGDTASVVDWPEDWYSLFITSVSVVGNQALVGKSYSWVRCGQVSNAKLHERVSTQLLTFGWPEQAHHVTAVIAEPGVGDLSGQTPGKLDPSVTAIAGTISLENYAEQGGMRIQLNHPGKVLLYPSRTYGGEKIWGEPTTLHYNGLRKFSYKLVANGHNRLALAIYSDREIPEYRSFTLVVRNDRLPLEPDDGQPIWTRKNSEGSSNFEQVISTLNLRKKGEPEVEYWELDPDLFTRYRTGFLRLFLTDDNTPGAEVNALIDPNPEQLSLDQWMRHFNPGGW
ncbi:hypothetical protein COCCU_12235 [Corynebacterium occultum]|uniref:Uncharacterized protein n=1 Tax=Corynebacterium occultum TaxID=2675219 RepID=A0A6B8W8S1_9CORY|nr:hypothetical protein [Corynebacterium occultum]QGU08347.1 hypothetical protein COCCU_12235 [Corynebacterium occultum]